MLTAPLAATLGLEDSGGSGVLSAELTVQGSTRLFGWGDLRVEAAAISFQPGGESDVATPEFSGEFSNARVRWLGLPRSHTNLDPAPVGPVSNPGPAHTWRDEVITGRFRVETWFEDAFILILPAEQGQVAPWRISGPLNATVDPPPGSPIDTPLDFWSPTLRRPLVYPGEAMRLAETGSSNTTLEGPMLLAVYGAAIVLSDGVHDRRIVTGERVSPQDSVILPTGQGVTQYNRSLLVLEAAPGKEVDLLSNLPPTVALYQLTGMFTGSAWFAGVEGHLERDGSSLSATGTLLEFDGTFALESSGEQEARATRWVVTGEPSAVRLDTEAIEIGNTRGMAIVVQTTLIGAIITWALWHFRDAVFALFQRTRTGPLGHELRVRLLDILVEKGPQTMSNLATQVGRSKKIVEWHLKKLEDGRLVRRSEDGPAHVFQAVSNATTEARVDLDGRTILAATHPARNLLLGYLTKSGRATFYDIHAFAQAHHRKPPSIRSLKYHASLLEDEGVILRRQEGRYTMLELPPR